MQLYVLPNKNGTIYQYSIYCTTTMRYLFCGEEKLVVTLARCFCAVAIKNEMARPSQVHKPSTRGLLYTFSNDNILKMHCNSASQCYCWKYLCFRNKTNLLSRNIFFLLFFTITLSLYIVYWTVLRHEHIS